MTAKRVALIMEVCVVAVLVLTVVAQRAVIAHERRIMPSGDVFNYQNIARHIRHGQYPAGDKRLPGFPLLLLAASSVGVGMTQAGIAVSIVSAGATVVVLYLLGRHFNWPSFPLAVSLLLLAVAPLFALNGVRPLADSYFLFLMVLSVYLVTIAKPTRRWALGVGAVLMVMMFTRYEGVPAAVLLLLCLRLRMPWRLVGLATLLSVAAGLLWLPVAWQAAGSWQQFGYVQDVGKNASLATLPADYLRLVRGAGFGRAWAITDIWSDDAVLQTEAKQMPRQLGWWLSVVGILGVGWMIFSLRTRALPLLLVFAAYPIAPAWWFTYSRFVGPLNAFYVFAVAAGAAGAWSIVSRLLKRGAKPGLPAEALAKAGASVVLGTLLVAAVWNVAVPWHQELTGKALKNNGEGYALYQAFMSLRGGDERVAVSYNHLVVEMILGQATQLPGPLNAGRGIYLSDKAGSSPAELAQYMQDLDARKLVDYGEPEVAGLRDYLRERGSIERTEIWTWPKADGKQDAAYLHYLNW